MSKEDTRKPHQQMPLLNYIKEFSGMAAAGGLAGFATLSFRPAAVNAEFHVIACSVIVGLCSVVLRSPTCGGTIAALVLLAAGRYSQQSHPLVGYAGFLLGFAYLAWNLLNWRASKSGSRLTPPTGRDGKIATAGKR